MRPGPQPKLSPHAKIAKPIARSALTAASGRELELGDACGCSLLSDTSEREYYTYISYGVSAASCQRQDNATAKELPSRCKVPSSSVFARRCRAGGRTNDRVRVCRQQECRPSRAGQCR